MTSTSRGTASALVGRRLDAGGLDPGGGGGVWWSQVVSCPTDCTGLSEGEACECGLTDGILEKKSAYQILSKYTGR